MPPDIPSLSVAASMVEELMPQLLRLNANTRLEIIVRLSPSLLNFTGAWADIPGTDEEIIATIHIARNFTRLEFHLINTRLSS